jgi:hypothetical protein
MLAAGIVASLSDDAQQQQTPESVRDNHRKRRNDDAQLANDREVCKSLRLLGNNQTMAIRGKEEQKQEGGYHKGKNSLAFR